MTTYSEILVFFLFLPVLTQIILPLLMLAGFVVARILGQVFGGLRVPEDLGDCTEAEEKLQVGRT